MNMVVWYRVHCTLGDLAILISSMGMSSLLLRRTRWILNPTWKELFPVVTISAVYTALSEYFNVRVFERWAYSELMPSAAGIGLVPIIQWLLLPGIVLWLATRLAWGVRHWKDQSVVESP
jgi:hypothetical protein